MLGGLLLEQISRKDADHLGENCNIGQTWEDYFCGVTGTQELLLVLVPGSENVWEGIENKFVDENFPENQSAGIRAAPTE